MIRTRSLAAALAVALACVVPTARADTLYIAMSENVVTYNTAVHDPKPTPFTTGVINALAIDSSGNVYAANGNYEIEKYSPKGKDLGVFASKGLNGPMAMVFDSAGNLYAANEYNNTIEKFSATGKNLGVFATKGLNFPVGLGFDAKGDLYVANNNNDNIEKFTSGGVGSHFATVTSYNESLAVDAAGNVYVSLGNNTIEKFTPGGVGSVFASGISGLLAFNSAGDLYVADNIHSPTIYELSPTGVDLGIVATPNLPIFAIAVESAAVPEPSSLVLSGLAIVSIGLFAYSQRRLRFRTA